MAVIGSMLEGKYEILKSIGKGGMSEVYLAMDTNLNKQWAVKEIKKNALDKNNQIVVQSAIAEANLMKKLDHPCLPRIVDIIDRPDVIYVVMDYIEGEPLNKVLEKEGPQNQEQVIEWALDLCDVLDYLHTQNPPIIYRDMKPANIMLQPNGSIKLIDFGIAREYKEQNLEDTVSLGTKGYAAPEQFGGHGQTDARTDIYCLGVTLYHLVTGKNPSEPPYEIYPIRYWNQDLSSGLESIIEKCTQLNPADRYQSCAELMYAIEHYEEADESYRNVQKKKVRAFSSVLAVGVLCLVVSGVLQLLKKNLNNNDYNALIQAAETSSSDADKIDNYLKAIDIKPYDLKAYNALLDVYKSDAVFTVKEENGLKKKLNANLAKLQEDEAYSDFAFNLGKLYWYYYEYGRSDECDDNQLTRMKSSIQWFSDVEKYDSSEDEKYLMSKMYRAIGEFNRDITLNVEEASDKGKYAPYFKNISSLEKEVKKGENEIVNLEVYQLCMSSVENYSRKFKNDGISKEDITKLLDNTARDTEKLDTTTDKTEEMKKEIMNRKAAAETALNNAFEEVAENE